jgi:iron complex outermembrane recepter protein
MIMGMKSPSWRGALSLLLCLGPSVAAQEIDDPASDGTAAAPEAERSAARQLSAIVVTGTRIVRIEAEGPLPISEITRQDLQRSGSSLLADALRELPQNAFGSFGELPNSSTPNASLPRLRGLDAKYTLTLLDGERLPGFARFRGGAAANLAGIPLAAIDRIEVLRDGASAIYGSDAIGGVINLITPRESRAPEFELQIEHPAQEGGEVRRAAFVAAHAFGATHLLASLETIEREPLLGAQRDFFRQNAAISPAGNPGSFRRIDPVSGAFLDFFQPDPRCPERLDSDPTFPSSAVAAFGPNRFCGYRFRDLNMERAAFRGNSAFVNLRHDLDDRLSLILRVLASDGEGRTQLAPTPVIGLRLSATNPVNPTLGERGPGLGYPLALNYRLSALGPRVSEDEERIWHVLAGLHGMLDVFDGGDWKLTLVRNRSDHRSDGVQGYALAPVFRDALANGRFDPFSAEPGNPAGLEEALYRPYSEGHSRSTGLGLAFTFDAGFFAGLGASWAFGLDARRDEYAVDFDPATFQGLVLGQGAAIAPEGAARSYAGVYGELFLPLGERWEASLAARYDRYQDAGGRLSPKLALAFRPSQRWLLRGSLGRGFQAPDLVSAYGGLVDYVAFEVDRSACAARPDDPFACELQFIDVSIVPNPGLGPERARQGQLGVMWQPTAAFDLGLDYVYTRIDGQIAAVEPRNALAAELDCASGLRSCNARRDGEVIRDEFGNITRIIAPYINIAGTRVEALDLSAGARRGTRWGELALRFDAARVLRFDRQVHPGSAVEQQVGQFGNPRWRGRVRLDWQRGSLGASFGAAYVDGYGVCRPTQGGGEDCADRVGSHTVFDAQARWRLPWSGEIALGGRNLGDRPPAFEANGNFAYGLYDIGGRVWYARYNQSF